MTRYKLEDFISSILFWVLVCVVFLQFFSRFFVGSPVGWTNEVSRYLLVATVFYGSIIVVRKQEDIALDYFQGVMGTRGKIFITQLVKLVCLIFYIGLAVIIFQVGQRTFTLMGSVDFPKKYLYYFVGVAIAMMGLRYGWSFFQATESPVGDER